MPRPGPRPYECVRRAWHSDRHQPMRGSIIQQILRLATEAHNSSTKKNKEWQEKLPIVVLRAEQIIYSKANSEAEYMNLETLWDRVNDAVDTIIRRDQSTETADLLPPCVEAALNLGCIPVRASRSQRYSNPRSYLSPRTQDSASKVANTSADLHCPHHSPVHSGTQLNFARGAPDVNLTVPVSQSNRLVTESNDPAAHQSYPIVYENRYSGHNQMPRAETKIPLNLGSVFPLYCGAHCQTAEPQAASQASQNVDCNIVFVGTPVCTSTPKHPEMGVLRTIFSSPGDDVACRRVEQQSEFRCAHGSTKPFGSECDLSLRLGSFSDISRRRQQDNNSGAECTDGSMPHEGFKVNDTFQQKSKEFCFFPEKNKGVQLEFSSRKWPLEGDVHIAADNMRKRKAPCSDNLEDPQFCWQYDSQFNPFSH